ncbi:MAG: PQQ-binding-like beta-propeller repeat protein [Armatimonadota bacterium]|nr:PQQ-binding-like beta-propeller repeat protein [Armatimonadota bacterium]
MADASAVPAMFRANTARDGTYRAPNPLRLVGARWAFETHGTVFSAPAVAGDLVCFGGRDRHVYAIDFAAGRVRWRRTLPHGTSSSPAVVADTVYIGGEDGGCYAFDLATGDVRWRFEAGLPIASSPAVADDVVYVGSGGARPGQRGGCLYALARATGHERWRVRASGGFYSSPAVARGVVVCGSRDGRVYAVDAASGQVRWTFATGGEVLSTPAIGVSPTRDTEVVYIGSNDGRLYALALATGERLWACETARALLDASPAVAAGVVALGGKDGVLRVLDADTGAERWRVRRTTETEPHTFSAPTVAGDVLLAGCSDGTFTAWALQTGRQLWAFTAPTSVWTSACVVGNAVCVGSGSDCRVYLLSTAEPDRPRPARCAWDAATFVALMRDLAPALALDYSADSVAALERFIGERFDPPGARSADDRFAYGLGCYLGEVIVRTLGGTWDPAGEPCVRNVGGIETLFPLDRARRRLAEGPEASLVAFLAAVTRYATGKPR